jgi:hypothetical protein
MAYVYADNVTKYNLGGSGDNIIADGYKGAVEKVWIDTYTYTTTPPSVGDRINIAVIPAGKKITDVQIFFPSLSTGASGTGTTINIGYSTAATGTSDTTFLSAGSAHTGIRTLIANQGIATATTAVSYVYLCIGLLAPTTTTATITSIVKYT